MTRAPEGLKSGKVSYRIVGMPDRDFPKVPDHREATYTTLRNPSDVDLERTYDIKREPLHDVPSAARWLR
jgi:hypothetical protein